MKYYGLSCEGAVGKRFLSAVRFHRGHFLFGKWFKEVTFWSKDAFKWTESSGKALHLYQRAVRKTAILTQGAVAEGTILIRKVVVKRMVSIRRTVIKKMVLIQRVVVG